jgi:hypothetical protein
MSRADSGRLHSQREELISRAFVTLADTLVDEYDVIELLNRLADFAVQLLPADAAGIVLGDARRELRAVAASDEAAHVMELLQLQSDQGPCLDCFQSAAPVQVADLTHAADRWPTFAAAVSQRGNFRSVHALPLRLRGRAIGALNLFSAVPGPLPEPDLALGQALADVATIGILQERRSGAGNCSTSSSSSPSTAMSLSRRPRASGPSTAPWARPPPTRAPCRGSCPTGPLRGRACGRRRWTREHAVVYRVCPANRREAVSVGCRRCRCWARNCHGSGRGGRELEASRDDADTMARYRAASYPFRVDSVQR